jgi:2-iminobutanoate/2-iminopropanoate deaminase
LTHSIKEVLMIYHFPPTISHAKIPPLSSACRVDDWVFVSGTPGYDEDMELDPSFTVQFETALQSLTAILARTGSCLENVVKVGIYLTRAEDIPEMNRLYGLAFGPAPYPARTTVIVAALPDPAMLVELECVAVIRSS